MKGIIGKTVLRKILIGLDFEMLFSRLKKEKKEYDVSNMQTALNR